MNNVVGVKVDDGHESLGKKLECLRLGEDVFCVLVVK